jgi:hypothetical protein
MRVGRYRPVVKPFEDAVSAGPDTHPAARATVAVYIDPNIHH